MASPAPDIAGDTLPRDENMKAAFAAFPPETGATLLEMRSLILETAESTRGVGQLAETLKWGQPSYTPAKPRTGSSVRLGMVKSGRPALFFICHSGLVDRFRELYGGELEFEGNRAILLPDEGPVPQAVLRHCIAMTLTWHIARR